MSQFGQARLVGLADAPEAGIQSYRSQVAEGARRDGPLARLRHLARNGWYAQATDAHPLPRHATA